MRPPLIAMVILVLAACDSPTEPGTPGTPVLPVMTAFAFEQADNPALRADAVGVIDGDTIRVVLPNVAAVTALKATFTLGDVATVARIGSTVQTSGVTAADFTQHVVYRLESSS